MRLWRCRAAGCFQRLRSLPVGAGWQRDSVRLTAQSQKCLTSSCPGPLTWREISSSELRPALLSVCFAMWLITSSNETSWRLDLLEEQQRPAEASGASIFHTLMLTRVHQEICCKMWSLGFTQCKTSQSLRSWSSKWNAISYFQKQKHNQPVSFDLLLLTYMCLVLYSYLVWRSKVGFRVKGGIRHRCYHELSLCVKWLLLFFQFLKMQKRPQREGKQSDKKWPKGHTK